MKSSLHRQIKDRIEWHKTYLAKLLADIENPDVHPEVKATAKRLLPYRERSIKKLQKLLE